MIGCKCGNSGCIQNQLVESEKLLEENDKLKQQITELKLLIAKYEERLTMKGSRDEIK